MLNYQEGLTVLIWLNGPHTYATCAQEILTIATYVVLLPLP